MAITAGNQVKFIQVSTLSKYNDISSKDPNAIYFVVGAKTIYVDGVGYGLSDEQANQFLKLTGGTMSGDINMAKNHLKNVGQLDLVFDGVGDAVTTFKQQADLFTMIFPDLNVIFKADGITLSQGSNPKIKGLTDPTANDEAVTLGYLNTNVINKKGTALGFASLDAGGKVPQEQLPSYVDDVIEGESIASLPAIGEAGKIYVAKDTNKTYRWSGTAYIEISASLALGETSSSAYRGDRGKEAYDHSLITSGNPHGTTKSHVGLGSVENYAIATKAEAEAGTVANKYMTPQRTKEAITALANKTVWEVVS